VVDYIGSKHSILSWLFSIIDSHSNISNSIFIDGCSGSGPVSIEAANRGANVVSIDTMSFSSILIAGKSSKFSKEELNDLNRILNELNQLPGTVGFLAKQYSELGGRYYFTVENASKIDAMRVFVDNLPEIHKNYFMYCILEAASRVCNTAGTHGAYLKKFKKCADVSVQLKLEPFNSDLNITPLTGDLLQTLSNNKFNETILYIDPPYTKRQYAPNYHLYETITLYDNPKIHGKTGLREWKHLKSPFCNEKLIQDYIGKILTATAAKTIFFSYSSDGLLPIDQFLYVIGKHRPLATVLVERKEHRRYKADSTRKYNSSSLYEYVVVVKC
jgi:adenine-specific DNA-methyltransferase